MISHRRLKVFNNITLSKKAIKSNLALLGKISGCEVMPVLKSNAYGHGIVEMATVLEQLGVKQVAVDGYYEALRIHPVFSGKILVMSVVASENAKYLKHRRISFVLQDTNDVKAFAAVGRKFNVHLEVNTGMNRLGIRPSEIKRYLKELKKYPKLHLEGVMTHLTSSDEPRNKTTERQVAEFDKAVELIHEAGFKPEMIHIANSAGAGRVKSRFANLARMGIALYGINTLDENDSRWVVFNGLRPVLELRSTIIKTINLQKGEKVGYGGKFVAPKAMRIGVLPLGYYEGVARSLSGRGVVTTTDGQPLKMVGRICTNHVMVDLAETRLKAGDELVVISRNPKDPNSLMSLQTEHGLFAYETLARLSPNIRRTVV